MKIFCFSDPHGMHEELKIPECDIIICSGDVSNKRKVLDNLPEVIAFLTWYNKLECKHKILVAGNHDSSIEKMMINWEDYPTITYLQHEAVSIMGINFFGSPYTPYFQDWSFMKKREKLLRYWEQIPSDTDVLITHGPPKGILDLNENRDHELEQCGDSALFKIVTKIQPKYHIFGHIHNNKDIKNSGQLKINGCNTTFINASCVTDARFNYGLSSHGVLINI